MSKIFRCLISKRSKKYAKEPFSMQSVNTTTYLLLPKSQEKGYIEKVYFWTKKDMCLHPLHTCILTLLLGVVKAP